MNDWPTLAEVGRADEELLRAWLNTLPGTSDPGQVASMRQICARLVSFWERPSAPYIPAVPAPPKAPKPPDPAPKPAPKPKPAEPEPLPLGDFFASLKSR